MVSPSKFLAYFFLALTSSQILIACATNYPPTSLSLITTGDYVSLLQSHTEKKQVYDGMINIMEFQATLMTSPIVRAQVDQNARIFQWNVEQYQAEKAKAEGSLANETQVFLSFFVPERKYDDLNKTSTKWKIFFDVGGKRYEGTAKKLKGELAEIQALYPEHTRWGTPYVISFHVPTSVADGALSKLTLTGPAGSASVDFNGK